MEVCNLIFQIPSDPASPCDLCYCIRNHTACVMQECSLKVEGCEPVYLEGVCCPVKYLCVDGSVVSGIESEEDMEDTSLTIRPPAQKGCTNNRTVSFTKTAWTTLAEFI